MPRRLGGTLLALFFLGFASASPGGADMIAKPKLQAGIPSFTILEQIMRASGQAGSAASVAMAPLVTWLAPSDPRIQPHRILSTSAGQLYAVRNFSGMLLPMAASVDYGVRQLHTPLLLITINTDNLAIAMLQEQGEKPTPELAVELQQLAGVLQTTGASKELQLGQVEQLVDAQVRQAVERYQDRIATQRLTVVGGVIDLANLYQRGAGRLIIINVNGEIDAAKLGQMPLMRRLNKENRGYLGRLGLPVLQPPVQKRATADVQK